MSGHHLTAAALALAATGAAAGAQCVFPEIQVLTPGAASPSLGFGTGVAVAADVAVVGTRSTTGTWVYREQGPAWVLEQVLPVGSGSSGGDDAVATDGTRIVVGVTSGLQAGSAGVFTFDGASWQLEQVLLPSLQAASFGTAVAVDGDLIAVGDSATSALCSTGDFNCGAVYVFRHDGTAWSEELVFGGSADGDRMGADVSLDGDDLAAGAPGSCLFLCPSGFVDTYRWSNGRWAFAQRLQDPPAQNPGDAFGRGVAIDAGRVLVGIPGDDFAAVPDSGSVKLFADPGAGSLVEIQNTGEPAPAPSRFHGQAVELLDDLAVAGAAGSVLAPVPGSAHVLHDSGSGWVRVQTFEASDGAGGDLYGGSVATDGAVVFVGAERAGPTGAGLVYVHPVLDLAFEVVPPPPPAGPYAFRICGGVPGTRALIGIVNPGFAPIARAFFDAAGQAILVGPVPPWLAGQTVDLRALGQTQPGVTSGSNVVTVTF